MKIKRGDFMRYKVYDTAKKSYIDDTDIILKSNGRLAVNDYGDEIGIPHCIALFYPTKNDAFYIDNIGGQHNSGHGWNPDGKFCRECSSISCELCEIWGKINDRNS